MKKNHQREGVIKERIQVATARLNKLQRTIDALAKYAQRKTQAEGRSLVLG